MTMETLTVRVARKTLEAQGICSFELVDSKGAALPAFEAGAHVGVQVPGGLVRQYSLCNNPSETHRYQIAVLYDPASRGGSRGMHECVNEGDPLTIGMPKNHFPLNPQAAHSLLLAGGIGITPLLAMAETLHATGASFELHYSARTRERMAFMRHLREADYAQRVHLHVDEDGPAQALDLDRVLARSLSHTHLYVCGPQGFIDAVLAAATRQGWPDARVHREFFSAPAVPVRAMPDQAFDVQLARSGQIVPVPAELSVARALEAAGVTIPVSCEQGVCGTCLTRVIDGVPDHRDAYLTPEEQAAGDQFLPCCSRAHSPRLVLDL